MKLKLVSLLLVLFIFTGCSNGQTLIYSAPTNEQNELNIYEDYLF